MTKYSLINECIDSINNVEEASCTSEITVLESLVDAYDKASTILEYYEGDDYESFDIFQESFFMEEDDKFHARRTNKDGNKENILKSILLFIPRLLKWLAHKIKTFFQRHKNKDKKRKEIIEKINNNPKTKGKKASASAKNNKTDETVTVTVDPATESIETNVDVGTIEESIQQTADEIEKLKDLDVDNIDNTNPPVEDALSTDKVICVTQNTYNVKLKKINEVIDKINSLTQISDKALARFEQMIPQLEANGTKNYTNLTHYKECYTKTIIPRMNEIMDTLTAVDTLTDTALAKITSEIDQQLSSTKDFENAVNAI
jgi:hypothetical protein